MMNFTSWGQNNELSLTAFEQQIGFALPEDYRLFLKENNGGIFKKQVFLVPDLEQDVMMDVLYGITNAESETLTLAFWIEEHGDELQENTLIIGSDPGGGIITYITTGDEQGIYYWDHAHFFPQSSEEEGNTYFVANSFAEFCESLMTYVPA